MGAFASLLRSGEFLVTAELNPPKSAAAGIVRRRAEALRGVVDAVNVTDSNRAMVAMAAIPAATIVRTTGLEPIVQMTGRDRNRIALQADLLGAAAIGIENFVFMSGDDLKDGNHPDAVNVKDLDGIGLVKMAVGMRDQAQFLSGDEIKGSTPKIVVGATASPFTTPIEADLDKTLAKIAAGAEFLQTQPVFDLATFSRWLVEVRRRGPRQIAIIAGVLVLRSAEQAERFAKVPGVVIGGDVIDRLKERDVEDEGIAIAVDIVKELRSLPGVRGVHIYAVEWPEAVGPVVEAAGLLPRPEAKVPA